MESNRRTLLKSGLAMFCLLLIAPMRALAEAWNSTAFEATQPQQALQGLGAGQAEASSLITLTAPDFAENGAIVQIEVESHIAGTQAIAILAEKNPTPLIANFMFEPAARPRIILRIKLAESGELKAIIKAGDKYYVTSRYVEVAIGGCN
jgi:sulfur-oxidizing protein SoxY